MKKLTYGLAMPLLLSMLAAGCEKAPSVVGAVDRVAPASALSAEEDLSMVDGTLYGLPYAQGFDWDRAVAQQEEDLAGGRVTQALGTLVPASVDLSSTFNQPIADQGKLGSCTAFATKAAVEYIAGKNASGSWPVLSALDIYYNTRMKARKSAASDTGATLKDTLDVLTFQAATDSFGIAPKTGQGHGIGALLESDWTYSTTATYSVTVGTRTYTKLKYQVAPQEGASASLIPDASRSAYVLNFTPTRIANPTPGGNVRVMREFLANKYPVIIGSKVYWSAFLNDPTNYKNLASASINTSGNLSMPGIVAKDRVYGAHAFTVVGYNDNATYSAKVGRNIVTKSGMFKLRSSWGTGYSTTGYYWMPYDYVTPSLVGEIWALNDFKGATR